MNLKRGGLILLATTLLGGAVRSQALITTVTAPTGVSGTSDFPSSVVALGDADGDGIRDYAAADRNFNGLDVGRVYLISGATHQILDVVDPASTATAPLGFGVIIGSAGDVDGDGRDDVLITGYYDVTVHQAGSPSPLAMVSGQYPRARRAGDYDGNGLAEIASRVDTLIPCTPPWASNYLETFQIAEPFPTPAAPALSISFISPCQSSFAPVVHEVYPAGDVTGDGLEDFLVSWQATGPTHTVTLLSPTPQPSGNQPFAPTPGYSLSFTGPPLLEVIGDCDGDGRADFATLAVNPPNATLLIRSGATALFLAQHVFGPADPFAASGTPRLAAVGDIDRDGANDVAVTRLGLQGNNVGVFSGRSGGRIMTIMAPTGVSFSRQAARAGDADGDGIDDLAVQGGSGSGNALYVYSLVPNGTTYAGIGCPMANGMAPTIGVRGQPVVGSTMTILASGLDADATPTLILGLSDQVFGLLSLPFDLAPIGAPGCLLRTSADFLDGAVVQTFGQLAFAERSYVIPPLPPGLSVHAQWLVEAPPTQLPRFGSSGAASITF